VLNFSVCTAMQSRSYSTTQNRDNRFHYLVHISSRTVNTALMQNSNPRDAQSDTPTSCRPPTLAAHRRTPTKTDMRSDKRGACCSSDAPADWPIQRGLCETERAETTGPSYSVGSSLGRAYMYTSGYVFWGRQFSGSEDWDPGVLCSEIIS
jgi:hypothetical protein